MVREGESVPDENLDRHNGHRNASEISPRVPDISRGQVLLESALTEIVADLSEEKGGREGLIGSVEQPGQQELGLVGEDLLERPLQSDGGVEDVVQTLSTFVPETTDVVSTVLERPVEACEALAPSGDPVHQSLRNAGPYRGEALYVRAHFPLLIGGEALDLFNEFYGAHGWIVTALILLFRRPRDERLISPRALYRGTASFRPGLALFSDLGLDVGPGSVPGGQRSHEVANGLPRP